MAAKETKHQIYFHSQRAPKRLRYSDCITQVRDKSVGAAKLRYDGTE
jgi:hypothetical protein